MSINFGVGSSSSLGESPTIASETLAGDLAMEIAESPNPNNAKPPKPNPKRKQRSDVWNHYRVESDGDGLKTCHCVHCGHK